MTTSLASSQSTAPVARATHAGLRPDRLRMRPHRALAATVVGLALLAGCSTGGGTESASPTSTPDPATSDNTIADRPATTTTVVESTEPAPEEDAILIARADQALTVRSEPRADATPVAELPATTVFGSPRALLVVDTADDWLEVQVPQRPNNATGWIEADLVDLVSGSHTVTVDLAARRLTVTEGDAVVLETPVAIGAPDAPTPVGTFAIVDRLDTPNDGGPYGPFALGLGGFSETLSEFGGGNGQIAIHGTDDPTSIGQAVSHGCIRVPNEVALQLADLLPLGTPVTIA